MSPLAPTSPNPLAILFPRQSIGDDAANAAHTLSSWNNCMAEAYCKWPVIVAIIIGALIVISIVICCARCLCCGLECCCFCCSCFNRCCPSPRGGSKSQYSQAPQQPYQYPPNQPYGYNPGMSYGPPQFAVFDASTGKVKEDALPAMPSWQTSESRRIEDTSYQGAGVDDALNKEMSGAAGGIAMGNMHSPTNEPVQYYEDPDESHRPMLDSEQQHLQQPQQHYTDDRLASGYQDTGSHAPSEIGQAYGQPNPSHPYSQYNQQQDDYANYPRDGAASPPSAYTPSYPPTYHTRPPTNQSYHRDMPSENAYAAPSPRSPPPRSPPPAQHNQYQGYASSSMYSGGDFSRSQSTNYGPSSPQAEAPVEMPGSLVPGGGQRYQSPPQQQQQRQSHELHGNSGSVYRKPVSGSWQ